MPSALITGASRGLGKELARQYAADGWKVIGTERGAQAEFPLDVSDRAQVSRHSKASRSICCSATPASPAARA